AFWARITSCHRQRPAAVDAASALTRPSPDPDYAGSSGLLGRFMGGRARRDARPLPAASLARGSALCRAHKSRQAARNLSLAAGWTHKFSGIEQDCRMPANRPTIQSDTLNAPTVPDAPPGNWVDRYGPRWFRPYARLAR